MKRLEAQLAAPEVTMWRPKPGDTVFGILVSAERCEGTWGPYPRLVIETDHGLVEWHAGFAEAKRQLTRRKPSLGDAVAIKYEGPPADGRPGHACRIAVERRPGADALDWRRFTEDVECDAPNTRGDSDE